MIKLFSFWGWAVMLAGIFRATSALATIDATLQMQLGNPSGATANTNNHDHYLIQRTVEALDYSDNEGEPLWASWDLTASDIGSSGRSSSFYTDTNLPADFYHVTTDDYNGVGNINFNRGHMCPSEDRTDSTSDNKLVFYMSNIVPQAAVNNQGVWGDLEAYCQAQAQSNNEILVTCGPSGLGTNRIPSGKAVIADYVWKIAVIVPPGSGAALTRITNSTRVIAVKIPNNNSVGNNWSNYLTSASQIEADTGFTFFTALPANLAAVLRARVDGSPVPGITNFLPVSGSAGVSVVIRGTNFAAASTVWFHGTNAAFTVNSSNQITATVPTGATTGAINIITPGGLAVSAGNFVVSPAMAPAFQAIRFTGNQFIFAITGASGTSYTISTATNLANPQWVTLLTTNPATVPFTFTDGSAVSAQRFYRVQNP